METSITCCDKKTAYISSDDRKWITKILELKDYPGVEIICYPEDNDGTVYAKIPYSWVTVRGRKKRELTEDELEAFRERAARMREMRKQNS